MRNNVACASVAMTLTLFVLASVGCVDEDPIVTGKRPDAGVADSGPIITTVVPGDDGPDDDASDCRLCQETLSTDTARGTLCRKNSPNGGPSSVQLLNSLVDCVCYDFCIDECSSYCSGAKNTNNCQLCITKNCGTPLSACLADNRP